MAGIQAVIFDLYGTLIRIRRRLLHKVVPRLLGVEASAWMALIRDELLTRRFEGGADFVRFVRERLAPERTAVEAQLLALVQEELGSVEPCDGALSLLHFLRRRGLALGLLSNASSIHKEPWQRLGFEPMFDAVSFSCDTGVCKPAPSSYLDLCDRLGVAPEATLVVGDSLPNDVAAPRSLGMRALRVGGAGDDVLKTTALLGFVSWQPGSELARLLTDGDRVSIGGRSGILGGLRMLPDSDQGRYNLVAFGSVAMAAGEPAAVFCKRYLFPDGAYVEEFAYALLAALGMPSCPASVTSGPEPFLVVSKAPGTKLEGATTPGLARQVGRHAALAYLFANADLRPRNAFVAHDGAEPIITMTDLEHCFLNLALDVSGIDEPLRPEALDRLSNAELEARVARRVLTPRTMKRARRAFFGRDVLPNALASAFEEGWMEAYREVQAQAERALGMLEERVHREPFLIVGTQAYRRAMARVDVDDVHRRLDEDAESVYRASFGGEAK